MTLILCAATTNPGKLRDFAVAAAGAAIVIEPLPGIDAIPAPEENEITFEANARLKAQYYSRMAAQRGNPVPVLADDSGLEVDALGGAPGVRSARFAQDAGWRALPLHGPAATSVDEQNNLCLLQQLEGKTRRTARYRCVLALARAGALLLTAEGSVEGEILSAPRGTGGFGYDPLFWLPDLQCTMAEISLQQKHALSHRGQAFRKLLPEIQTLFGSARVPF